jgi:hypothetical protein
VTQYRVGFLGMRVRQHFVSWALVVLMALLAAPAVAGLLKVTDMLPGSQASVSVTDADGNSLLEQVMTDVNMDGMVEFGLKDQGRIKRVVVWKTNKDGARIEYDGKFVVASLPSIEPFSFPTFASLDPGLVLLAQIDISAFLASPNPFVEGSLLAIVDGAVALSTAVTFRDASSLAFPPTFPFDLTVLDTLPTFDGVARVTAADSMAPVPEPSALWLWALGVMGVFALRRGAGVLRTARPHL